MRECVTGEATHFGIKQKLTSKITAFKRPILLRDKQLKGAFKFIKHDHYFESKGDKVVMKDVFEFESPYGLLGKLVDKLILTSYLRRFLIRRNNVIKEFAETNKWKTVPGMLPSKVQ